MVSIRRDHPVSILTYPEIIKKIEDLELMPETPPSLDRIKEGLKKILTSSSFQPHQTIVVAGTNGKGSVCVFLEALFLSMGESVGLFSSPHLEETTERIRINGKDIEKNLFCKAYEIVNKKTKDLKLSHFEILTLIAAWVFYSKESDLITQRFIFEVGLGGTWDATNAIPHQNCVITSLDYDHQNLLGHTLKEIALSKFGIIGPQSIVVHSPLPKEVQSVAQEVQISTKSYWRQSAPFSLKVIDSKSEPQFILQTEWGKTKLGLPGLRSAQNATTALTLFHELGYQPEKHIKSLSQIRWPGRMERILHPNCLCPLYFSGDHNPGGIKSLLELLPYYPRNHLYILLGIGKDKDQNGILAPLFKLPDTSIFLTETPFRGRSLNQYGSWLDHASGAFLDPLKALKTIMELAKPCDLILITGSLYLVGFLRKNLKKL